MPKVKPGGLVNAASEPSGKVCVANLANVLRVLVRHQLFQIVVVDVVLRFEMSEDVFHLDETVVVRVEMQESLSN